jgi:hypothetical protein
LFWCSEVLKKLYCNFKNSVEFTTLKLRCLTCSGELHLRALLWSHAKQVLSVGGLAAQLDLFKVHLGKCSINCCTSSFVVICTIPTIVEMKEMVGTGHGKSAPAVQLIFYGGEQY